AGRPFAAQDSRCPWTHALRGHEEKGENWPPHNARRRGSIARMNVSEALPLLLDPARLFRAVGREPDPWQRDLLLCPDRQILLNCSRQSGKSTTVSALALHTALFGGGLVLILSPSQRQSGETFRKVLDAFHALGRPLPALHETDRLLELAN